MIFRVFSFALLACLLVDGAAYWMLRIISQRIGAIVVNPPPAAAVTELNEWVQHLAGLFWPYFVPASVVLFALIALLTILTLRRLPAGSAPPKATKAPVQTAEEIKAELEQQMLETHQRLYLHLIAVLQKEGRLLDFFSEDLAQYDDAQIGAAVRNIQENCKKVLQNHVAPQAVLKQNEGEEIMVEKDFDPNLIKLVGNVTGKPPFKGVVQHRGWRARKLELPTFPGRQAPDIIAPAEVEVK